MLKTILGLAGYRVGLGFDPRRANASAVVPPPMATAAIATFAPVLKPPPPAAAAGLVRVWQVSIVASLLPSDLPIAPCPLSTSPLVPFLVLTTTQPCSRVTWMRPA